MTTTARRAHVRSVTKESISLKASKKSTISTDELADVLSSTLQITNTTGKQKAVEPSATGQASNEDLRIGAMRAVNSASQALSNVVQSGWKYNTHPSGTVDTALTQATSSSLAVTKHLSALRRLCSDQIDVERAAASVLGKLVALEMFGHALPMLQDMYPRICGLLNVNPFRPPSKSSNIHLLAIPLPSTIPSDTIILTLISTYLSHAISIFTNLASTSKTPIDLISQTLMSPSMPTLLSWIPSFSTLTSKHIDTLLIRSYTTLTKLASNNKSLSSVRSTSTTSNQKSATFADAQTTFNIRIYGLSCLVKTSPGAVSADMFWGQTVRFTTAFTKASVLGDEERVTHHVLTVFADLVAQAEARPDKDVFLCVLGTTNSTGNGFLGFCEQWTNFAKRAGDIYALERVRIFMNQGTSNFPYIPTPCQTSSEEGEVEVKKNGMGRTEKGVILDGTRICTSFAQLAAYIEQRKGKGRESDLSPNQEEEFHKCVRDCKAAMTQSKSLSLLLGPQLGDGSDEICRIQGKVDRAFERMRRMGLKFIEDDTSSQEIMADGVRTILETCADILQESSHTHSTNNLTRLIDTLFILAKTMLNVADPRTYTPTFDYLSRASSSIALQLSLPKLTKEDHSAILSNYVRCISGAFHNMAGKLYQGGRYGAAVPFLKEGCILGSKAIALYRGVCKESKTEQTDEPAWKDLEEQLCRRWELLGVCYAKNGDRQNAYKAFIQYIKTFPFSSTDFASNCNTIGPSGIFKSPQSTQLGTIIERVTYMGACEFFLNAEEISLRNIGSSTSSATFGLSEDSSIETDLCVLGALLERQLESVESSLWKEGVRKVYEKLLWDALEVYSGSGKNAMPVRRARVLLRCLELQHRRTESGIDFGSVQELSSEMERILTQEDLGLDSSLAHYCAQYRISAHLWLALDEHRQTSPNQTSLMKTHVDAAVSILKKLLSSAGATKRKSLGTPKAGRNIVKDNSRRVHRSPKASVMFGRTVGSPKTSRVQRVPSAPRKVAHKMVRKDPVTPKAKAKPTPHKTSVNVTPPRESLGLSCNFKSPYVFENFHKFLGLLQLTARLLGLLALNLSKTNILIVTRKLCEEHMGSLSDGFIMSSIDLAYEYSKLGKIKRAATIFSQAFDSVKSGQASDEACVMFFLRYAEVLAILENVPKSCAVYCEALSLAPRLDFEDKSLSTIDRVHTRVKRLERAAIASHVFGLIQNSKENMATALQSMLQSLRLWNRAAETLERLNPSPSNIAEPGGSNPFEMSDLKDALTDSQKPELVKKTYTIRKSMDGLEWRISEGLLTTMFALCDAYLERGSAREAEFFAQQAQDLAGALNISSMVSRALSKKGELLLHQGLLEEAYVILARAEELLQDVPGVHVADIHRLRGHYSERAAQPKDALQLYREAIAILDDLDTTFKGLDVSGQRKSIGFSPGSTAKSECLVPSLFAKTLRHQILLLLETNSEGLDVSLERFMTLSNSSSIKAEEHALMAKLTLHSVYERFRSDMFLSSLAESAIALPMGMSSNQEVALAPVAYEIMKSLDETEKLYWENLKFSFRRGTVPSVRDTLVSLALVRAFQTSLGKLSEGGIFSTIKLLDNAMAITLKREMAEVCSAKFPAFREDLQWPRITPDGVHLPFLDEKQSKGGFNDSSSAFGEVDDSDGGCQRDEKYLKAYWESIRAKYESQTFDQSTTASTEVHNLPSNWTVIHVTVTEDKSTLFISRQNCGPSADAPLVFRVPLKGRRDNGSGEDGEEQLTFDDALEELHDIVRLSNEGTKAAVHVRTEDDEARAEWWKQRGELDTRMRELLENIEFCWLGAFKTILNPHQNIPPDAINELRAHFEKIFQQSLHLQGKTTKSKVKPKVKSKRAASQARVQQTLDETLMQCFATLSPKCRDEELEDLVYFLLDLYQFHGVTVAIAEVDVTQVVVDLRAALEEHRARISKYTAANSFDGGSRSKEGKCDSDEHLFLVLDRNVQALPWESIPVLRGRSVSRIPSLDFLRDSVDLAQCRRRAAIDAAPTDLESDMAATASVNASNGYFILNPSGDLGRTEERFKDWVGVMRRSGWDGVVGKAISEQQFLQALRTRDLVVYFGHGGGEQYVRAHKIRSLPRCAATMLWGCSSGALRDMGEFDGVGTPNNYVLAGCPTLVANLWDVTDRDIDKFSHAVFDKLRLSSSGMDERRAQGSVKGNFDKGSVSVVAAVAQSRDVCKLRYLTGAAPVVYGIPFYL